jgi:hypothetical protein
MADRNNHVEGFVARVQKKYRFDRPELFWDCEAEFAELLKQPFLADVLNQELASVATDATRTRNWLGSELILHRGNGFGLCVSIFEAPQRYIHSLPYHAMYVGIGSVGLRCNTYELPPSFRYEVFDPTLRLVPAGQRTATPGEILHLPSGKHAYDFIYEQPTPVLKFMTSAIHPLEWLFSRTSLQAWQANDADLSFTQLRVAADVVGTFAHQSSLQPLKRLAQHKHHAVRWTAIQNLARVSRSDAVECLREAVNDPHPHVQRAARKTLDKLTAK